MSNEQECQCGQAHGACATEFQYAVKLVGGTVAVGHGAAETPVAPGRYWTAINIHNPDKCRDANFRWKVVVAAPLGQNPAIPTFQRPRTLGPDMALEIDWAQVKQTFPSPPPTFVKGYVVIESDVELDVVAVYTGTQGGNTPLNSFHTERVHPRSVPVCEDLILPLHTGFAGWQTVAPTSGLLGPVVPVSPFPSTWAAPPFGSSWVSQAITDGTNASLGTRHYELCFNLCFGFTVPLPFQIRALADDSATIQLNGNPVGNINAPGYTTPATFTVNPNFLRPGRNCFRVSVLNGPPPAGGPTGFALAGILRVVRGKCPCSPLPIASPRPGIPITNEPDDNSLPGSDEKAVKRQKKRGS